MNDRTARIIIVVLLVLVVGLPFVLRPAASEEAAAIEAATGPRPRLVIITPHNEQIRFEIAGAFNAWRLGQGRSPIEFDWRSSGGTSDLRKQVLAELERAVALGREDQGINYDVFFGGGDYEHNVLATGVTATRNGQQVRISASEPIQLPTGALESAYPEPMIGSEPLYHPQLHWVGVVLSSFGIVYNRDVLDMLDLPEPHSWDDLINPRYRGWVALSDPGHSGSIAATYNSILRRMGWADGWRTLRMTFANARYFTASASKVPVDVSAGEAAAGMCIDFYGRFQSGAIADAQGHSRVGYVDPRYMTAITADPVSIVRGAPNRELATEFVTWLISADAQKLWQRKRGVEHGPRQFELRRLPIRRDLYTPQEMQHWTDQVDPWQYAAPFPAAMPNFYGTVGTLTHAMAVDIHDDLIAAWEAMNRLSVDDPRRAECEALFHAMPPELTLTWPSEELERNWQRIIRDPLDPRYDEVAAVLSNFMDRVNPLLSDADSRLSNRLAWTSFFRSNYRSIIAIARGR